MDQAIVIENLSKKYRNNRGIENINLEVSKGEIFGFLGPNGAGKTTAMKVMTGLMTADSGRVRINGFDIAEHYEEAMRDVGCIIEGVTPYAYLTAMENLRMCARFYDDVDDKRILECLDAVGIGKYKNEKVKNFSLGMKQRMAIALAVMHDPELLILDEPINALDPEGIREMRRLFQRLSREQGVTIFISSHILSEVEQIADSIGILSGGKLQKEVSMEEIHGYLSEYLEIKVDDVDKAAALLEQSGRIVSMKVLRENRIQIFDAELSAKELAELLVRHGVGLEELMQKQGMLEEYFFHLTEEAK